MLTCLWQRWCGCGRSLKRTNDRLPLWKLLASFGHTERWMISSTVAARALRLVDWLQYYARLILSFSVSNTSALINTVVCSRAYCQLTHTTVRWTVAVLSYGWVGSWLPAWVNTVCGLVVKTVQSHVAHVVVNSLMIGIMGRCCRIVLSYLLTVLRFLKSISQKSFWHIS